MSLVDSTREELIRLLGKDGAWVHSSSVSDDEAYEKYKELRATIRDTQNKSIEERLEGYAWATDYWLQVIHANALEGLAKRFTSSQVRHCVLALGGYGRKEMFPESDVDILLLVDSSAHAFVEALVESFLYPLWDRGIQVGYAVRNISDTIKFAKQDVHTWTALLDSRFLCGSQDLYGEFESKVSASLYGLNKQEFIRSKWNDFYERRATNSTVFGLEPNVKESPGGLRDLHTLQWSVQVRKAGSYSVSDHFVFEKDMQTEYEFAQRQLWEIREAIHWTSGKKGDTLHLHIQDAVAERLGIEASSSNTRSELLMSKYFHAARFISNLCEDCSGEFDAVPRHRRALYKMQERTVEGLFRSAGGRIWFRPDLDLESRPELSLRLLRVATEQGLKITYSAARKIDALSKKKAIFRTSPVREEFLSLFHSDKCGRILEQMHARALLPRLLREFQHLWCRMQHDAYHSYTTDVHLIQCVIALDEMLGDFDESRFPIQLKSAIDEIEDLQMLRLAVFLHDVGKGYGKNHSTFGAELCKSIGRRFKYDSRKTARIELLVRHHLLQSDLAQRADINDTAVVRRFCDEVGDIENLNLLYVLTLSDQQGVASNLLTPWKVGLLNQLYVNARTMLETGDTRGRWLNSEVRARRKTLSAEIRKNPETYSPEVLKFSTRYFLTFKNEILLEHAAFLQSRDSNNFAAQIKKRDDELLELWVTGTDQRGLFVQISALMYKFHMSVVNTDAFVQQQGGQVFNMYILKPKDDYFVQDDRKVEKLIQSLAQVFDGQFVEKIEVSEAQSTKIETLSEVSSRRDVVRWNNDLSEENTVFELQTWDRIGLLYLVSEVLYSKGFDITTARIDTRGGRVSDFFYVRDQKGYKCLDFELLDETVEAIRESIK